MASRAIIESIIDERRAKVRIPTYDGSADSSLHTPDDELSIATIATPNGVTANYKRGDIVFVEFEDNDIGKPIIIGNLQRGNNNSYNADMSSDRLNINKAASLPVDTTIGDINYSEIDNLKGLDRNVQQSLITLEERADLVEKKEYNISDPDSLSYTYNAHRIMHSSGLDELIVTIDTLNYPFSNDTREQLQSGLYLYSPGSITIDPNTSFWENLLQELSDFSAEHLSSVYSSIIPSANYYLFETTFISFNSSFYLDSAIPVGKLTSKLLAKAYEQEPPNPPIAPDYSTLNYRTTLKFTKWL